MSLAFRFEFAWKCCFTEKSRLSRTLLGRWVGEAYQMIHLAGFPIPAMAPAVHHQHYGVS
ncbi:hypothetical protein C9418_25605 [Rhizobium sp. SEMIA 4032]|nr:hypothetical protein C9418_25605 [Rhizobium sp. SEMIA 4032]